MGDYKVRWRLNHCPAADGSSITEPAAAHCPDWGPDNNRPGLAKNASVVSGHAPKRPVVAVIDGQGGGFGAVIIKELRASFGDALEIWALGANSSATSAMMKAKANRGATGENAVRVCLPKANAVMGPIAVSWANAMMGEISPGLAAAVTSSPVPKILIPLSQEGITLAGFAGEPLPHLVNDAVRQLALIACSGNR